MGPVVSRLRPSADGGEARVPSPAANDTGAEPSVGTVSAVAMGCTLASLLVILLGAGVLLALRLV